MPVQAERSSPDGTDSVNLMILVRAVVSPLYRFWSPSNLRHFYALSVSEKNYIEATWPDDWTYEGIAWYTYE